MGVPKQPLLPPLPKGLAPNPANPPRSPCVRHVPPIAAGPGDASKDHIDHIEL